MKAIAQVAVVFGFLLIVCATASVLLLRRLDKLRDRTTLEEVLYISSPKALKKMSLAMTGCWLTSTGPGRCNISAANTMKAPTTSTFSPSARIQHYARSATPGGLRLRCQFSCPGAAFRRRHAGTRDPVGMNSEFATIPTSGDCITTKALSVTWI